VARRDRRDHLVRRRPGGSEAVLPGDLRAAGVEDADSAAFRFGATIVNLLVSSAAPELIDPAPVAPREAGARMQLTIEVDDVDAVCARLVDRGVRLLNGPMDRPWGVRTASFLDPGGHIWEIAR
jgi:catechol 2,3-dioxygenase-like lactoylglutathione lyase family enzyme